MPSQPSDVTKSTITRLLSDLEHGSRDALDALLPLIYDELRSLAHRQRLRWHGAHTLATTALVHEAYLKLVNQRRRGEHPRTFLRARFPGDAPHPLQLRARPASPEARWRVRVHRAGQLGERRGR
jgi:hypothetical protein